MQGSVPLVIGTLHALLPLIDAVTNPNSPSLETELHLKDEVIPLGTNLYRDGTIAGATDQIGRTYSRPQFAETMCDEELLLGKVGDNVKKVGAVMKQHSILTGSAPEAEGPAKGEQSTVSPGSDRLPDAAVVCGVAALMVEKHLDSSPPMEVGDSPSRSEPVRQWLFAYYEGDPESLRHCDVAKVRVGMCRHYQNMGLLFSNHARGACVDCIASPVSGKAVPPLRLPVGPSHYYATRVPGNRPHMSARLLPERVFFQE